jgi:hypothetical protein
MLRALVIAAVLTTSVVFARSASADDWMFQPSAYSYSPRRGVEFGPDRFSRGPYYGPQYGAFYRSGYRNLHTGGWGYGGGWGGGWGGWGGGDYGNVNESWFQTGEQYMY